MARKIQKSLSPQGGEDRLEQYDADNSGKLWYGKGKEYAAVWIIMCYCWKHFYVHLMLNLGEAKKYIKLLTHLRL